MAFIGYARVSTRDQDLAGQLAELEAFGCERSYHEKESGARSDRPQLRKAISRLTQGDVLVVTRLDRLARSTRDLLNVLAQVSERGAGFKSLKDAWADTTTPHGRLMLTVLGGLAEFERELIRARHRRRQEAGKGPWREVWTATEALAPSTAGSPTAALGRRFMRRSRTNLWRRPHDHRTPTVIYVVISRPVMSQCVMSRNVTKSL